MCVKECVGSICSTCKLSKLSQFGALSTWIFVQTTIRPSCGQMNHELDLLSFHGVPEVWFLHSSREPCRF